MNSTWIQNLREKGKTIKLMEHNVREYLGDLRAMEKLCKQNFKSTNHKAKY